MDDVIEGAVVYIGAVGARGKVALERGKGEEGLDLGVGEPADEGFEVGEGDGDFGLGRRMGQLTWSKGILMGRK